MRGRETFAQQGATILRDHVHGMGAEMAAVYGTDVHVQRARRSEGGLGVRAVNEYARCFLRGVFLDGSCFAVVT